MADETGAASAAGSSPAPSTVPSSSPVSSTPAPATVAPAGSDPGTQTATATGEPPQERWSDILASTRTKTRAEVEAEYKQKYGWAEQYSADPYAFVDQQIDRYAQHPQYGPAILAKAARMLAARRGAQPQQTPLPEKPKADVPVMDEHNRITGYVYSDQQQDKLDAWREAKTEAALSQRLAPLTAMRDQVVQAQQQAKARQQSAAQASATLAELRQQPHFSEHETAIKQALIDHPAWGDNVHRAYVHVLTTKVLPELSRTEQTKVLDSLKQKAAGGTVNPGQTAPTQTPKFTSFRQALEYFAEHPDEAAAMANR